MIMIWLIHDYDYDYDYDMMIHDMNMIWMSKIHVIQEYVNTVVYTSMYENDDYGWATWIE